MTDERKTEVKTEGGEMKKPVQSIPAPAEPPAPKPVESAPKKYDVENMDMKAYVCHVLLWNDITLSAKIAGLFFVMFYYTCEEGYTLGSFIACALMFRTFALFGLNAGADFCKSKEHAVVKKIGQGLEKTSEMLTYYLMFPNEKNVAYWVDGLASFVKDKTRSAADALEKAEIDFKNFKTVIAYLVGLYIFFAIFSLRTLLIIAYVIGFTAPVIYKHQQSRIDPLIDQAQEKLEPYVDLAKEKIEEVSSKAMKAINEGSNQLSEKVHDLMKKKGSVQVAGANAPKKTN